MWTALSTQPTFAVGTMLLLTDGTVMCQEAGGKNWWRLSPDSTGDYITGSLAPLAPMHHSRLYFASAVLADGRVFVAGGEYSDAGGDLDAAELYDPVLNAWKDLPTPAGWTNIGDAPCCVLPDGKLLLGSINTTATAIFDPVSQTWSSGPAKADTSSEETWTLLPDQTVLAPECSNHPNTEKYVAPANQWVTAGATPQDLVQASSIEIGPAILLTDGRVLALGATGHTALYTPPAQANDPGSWVTGPDFPKDINGKLLEPKDAPACLLPNGRVLCVAGPAGEGGSFPGPTQFFECDGSTLTAVPNPPNHGGPPFVGRMILVPTGQVLFGAGSADIEVYTPDGSPDEDWRPTITSHPVAVRAGRTYTIFGRQLNGLSQAVSYGDDASMATNYPLVRLEGGGRVIYCRTFDHSTMGVATGTMTESTSFKVPAGVSPGSYRLCLVANGISSECVPVTVVPFLLHLPINEALVNRLIGSLADGPLWVITPHGPEPVGPWDGDIAIRAQAAWSEIRGGIEVLEQLGRQLGPTHDALRSKEPAVAVSTPSGARRRTGVKVKT
ncbi:MAG TPA: kelch repeat-containing protein [Candidatus Dormibacteraeota bacterium]